MLRTALVCSLMASAPGLARAALSDAEMLEVLKTIDVRQRNSGDYKTLVYIEQKERDKSDLLYEAVVYRRDENDQLVILFTKPKAEAGKGYLRIDKSLFLYDPAVGKWERRTERERIGGTSSQRADFDESRLAEEYTPTYVGEEKLGVYTVHHLLLKMKEGADVAYPITHLWVDAATHNVLKRTEMALSGRLMRTVYYPQWNKVWSESKKDSVYYPKEIRVFDEVEKGNRTTVVLREIDLRSLDPNIFTKAWVESRSR
ncbi:MAG: outer membrane lipoprotein-sorting protein [Deltaproteobacteria bacterium]|nr:outer membrane lipoprotein-sorting protein [Deltaproteobacteria bacterium]